MISSRVGIYGSESRRNSLRQICPYGISLLLTAALGLEPAPGADVSTPQVRLQAGQAQLFVDDFLISQQNGLVRTLHQPKKDDGGNRPVIALADEFGETK